MVGNRPVDKDEIQAMMESSGLKLLARTSLKTIGWIQSRLYWNVAKLKLKTWVHGNSHSEVRLNGGTSTKKSYIWLLEDQLEDHSLHGELNYFSFTYMIVDCIDFMLLLNEYKTDLCCFCWIGQGKRSWAGSKVAWKGCQRTAGPNLLINPWASLT